MNFQLVNSIHAAKVHREIVDELFTKKIVYPGQSIDNIVNYIEENVKQKIGYDPQDPLKAGCAFPANISVNETVAHYTSSKQNNNYILKKDDIVKVDFGVHKQGGIIDSACTFYFDDKYKDFIDISKKTTQYAIDCCGPDVHLGELGEQIEEYVRSKEIEIDDKTVPLYTLSDLSGHNIGNYLIHKSKAVPNIKFDYPVLMEEGEFYAIEPFVSTYSSESYYNKPIHLYMLNRNYEKKIKHLNNNETNYFNEIKKQYDTLCFCDRWLQNDLNQFNQNNLNGLVHHKVVDEFETIYVPNGHYVSQFEHNIFIKKNGVSKLTENKYY